MSNSPSCVERAPAKVNLWLRILGRCEDGYHELQTLMLALDLADELRARATDSGVVELRLSGVAASADVPADHNNLVWRVADDALRFAKRSGLLAERAGLALELVKRIPSRAGLGGGSSDAAAALRALERVWQVDLGDRWRRSELTRVGADCVFFHDAGESSAALCSGIGELVEPLPGSAPAWSVLLLTPEVECSTPAIFGAWAELDARREPCAAPSAGWLERSAAEARAWLGNDLEAAALHAVPELRAWRTLLDLQGLEHACLSGSGSSFFALFDSAERARASLEGVVRAAGEQGLQLRHASLARPLESREV